MRSGKSKLIYPFKDEETFTRIGIAAARGDGAYVIDERERRYFDAISGLWNVPLGYSCQPIKDAINRQLEALPAYSLIVGAARSARNVATVLIEAADISTLGYAFLCSGGSEAIETAIKLSRHHFHIAGQPEKRIVLSFRDSYHGMTLGALAASGISEDKEGYGEPLPDVYQVTSPKLLLRDGGANRVVEEVSAAIDRFGPRRIAALIVEPVFAVAGMIAVPSATLRALSDLCADTEVLLIADEVTTGVFRAGNSFLACAEAGIRPDLVTLAKALTNGYVPFGATLLSHEIHERLADSRRAFMHGYTFSGNPLACAASVACIDELRSQKAPPSSAISGAIEKASTSHLDGNRYIAGWRQTGGLLGVDLDLPFGMEIVSSQIGLRIMEICLSRGVIVRPTYGGATFNIVPMYISSAEEIDSAIQLFSSVVEEVIHGYGRRPK